MLSASTTKTASKPSLSRIRKANLSANPLPRLRRIRTNENPRARGPRARSAVASVQLSATTTIWISSESGTAHAATLRTHRTIAPASLCAGITIASLAIFVALRFTQAIRRGQDSRECDEREFYSPRQSQHDKDRGIVIMSGK